MSKIKKYEDFVSEEINLKKAITGAALGAGLAFSNPSISQTKDTTSHISVNSIKNIIGKTLIVKPIKSTTQVNMDGYRGFYTKYSGEGNWWNNIEYTYMPGVKYLTNKGKLKNLPGYSKIDIEGKSFKVVDIVDGSQIDDKRKNPWDNEEPCKFIKMIDDKNNIVYYYYYNEQLFNYTFNVM